MTIQERIGRRDHLTFKGNLRETRYGWLRLTPAYSVHLVAELLDARAEAHPRLLDPFCGTGTTALVCAERGIACDTTDINPFLLWLTGVKTHSYTLDAIEAFRRAAVEVAAAMRNSQNQPMWAPPIHQIEKWWDVATLNALGRAMDAIKGFEGKIPGESLDLLKIAFCRIMIEGSSASFGHQSMSFKRRAVSPPRPPILGGARSRATRGDSPSPAHRRSPSGGGWGSEGCSPQVWGADHWQETVASIARAAAVPIITQPRTFLCDARNLTDHLAADAYDCIITSPPYPNRMSYIRELRPYMYWLGYLQDGRQAGELDWEAIGGTWGVATSNVAKWMPEDDREIPHPGFSDILNAIAGKSPVLSRYVHKYFADMVVHTRELFRVVRPGGTIHYIVGNSRFYDVMVPVEQIFAALFEAAGFIDADIRVVRKRTSKKELFEYLVSARKPRISGTA
jgi:DNA modification methylase